MKTFEEVPAPLAAAFGDLSRFEEQLRDGFGVGQLQALGTPYSQHPAVTADPNWHESLRDEGTGLYLPAMLAAQVIVNQVALPALERGEGIRSGLDPSYSQVLAVSVQLPPDDVAPFTIDPEFDNATSFKQRIAANNSQVALQGFLDEYNINGIAATIRVDRSKAVPESIWPGRDSGFTKISTGDSMHADAIMNPGPEVIALASTARPTLCPLGAVVLKLSRSEVKYPLIISEHQWDDESLREVAPSNRVGVMTGYTLHTISFGEYAGRYIDPMTGYAERVFSRTNTFLQQ